MFVSPSSTSWPPASTPCSLSWMLAITGPRLSSRHLLMVLHCIMFIMTFPEAPTLWPHLSCESEGNSLRVMTKSTINSTTSFQGKHVLKWFKCIRSKGKRNIYTTLIPLPRPLPSQGQLLEEVGGVPPQPEPPGGVAIVLLHVLGGGAPHHGGGVPGVLQPESEKNNTKPP